jgi:hypothetical protein
MREYAKSNRGCCRTIGFDSLFSKCKKEYSYEGGTAVFSMLNNNGACAASLSGNYFDGVSLSSNNTVQLQVNVTTTGVQPAANTRAGFLFSTAGSFSDTGVQTITLTGTGTPDSVGDFSSYLKFRILYIYRICYSKQIVLASYSLSGEPNMCANAQVNGQYLTG